LKVLRPRVAFVNECKYDKYGYQDIIEVLNSWKDNVLNVAYGRVTVLAM
jgi:hypothetical protein